MADDKTALAGAKLAGRRPKPSRDRERRRALVGAEPLRGWSARVLVEFRDVDFRSTFRSMWPASADFVTSAR
jgi:hypothetical protein